VSDWFWEGNVQRAVVGHLVDEGWTIESETDTASRARGIDIVATNNQRRLAVEVKGFPATTYARGPKAGQTKPTPPTLQARHWLAEALLTTLLTRTRHADHEIAIALPDVPHYRALLGKRMSLEEIAEKLNLENVPTIHGTNRWTAASVRKAFVS
jgi:hypothetical protein